MLVEVSTDVSSKIQLPANSKINILYNFRREICLFLYALQPGNINKRNKDYHWQFTFWTIDKKYWLSWTVHIFFCVFCLFSSASFYTAMAQENGWCSVSGRIIQVVYSFAPIILNKVHAMLFAANVHEFILLPRISSLGQRKQFYDSKYSNLGCDYQ